MPGHLGPFQQRQTRTVISIPSAPISVDRVGRRQEGAGIEAGQEARRVSGLSFVGTV